ncbi:MAG: DNA methyltransferase [Aigarchaeota archaeon]|nr:DNA methyltransferase [Candidatus Calditenuaceae archaeon]
MKERDFVEERGGLKPPLPELGDVLVDPSASNKLASRIMELGVFRATVHTTVYRMHKFWARRPWAIFRALIRLFTKPGDIILDPFAGGGVTLVEGLIERRKVIAVDINPLAVKIMIHQVKPLDIETYRLALEKLKLRLDPIASELYRFRCPRCRGQGVAKWTEFDSLTDEPLRVSYECSSCGGEGVLETEAGSPFLPRLPTFPIVEIDVGDKTADLLKRGIRFYHELFTSRNLFAVLKIKEEIERVCRTEGLEEAESFLLFTLSSTLKWASKMSHLKGEVLEGWAMHSYWIYPKFVEVNVWRQFLNRARAVIQGKEFSNKFIGDFAREAKSFEDMCGGSTYMVIEADARSLPLPSECVDIVITDPPYGGNVNYGELADYFLWLFGVKSPKRGEIVINRTRRFTLSDYECGLREVFRECYRVLKPSSLLISTFNSKDAKILAAFIRALRGAGFAFRGVSFQPYLKAYETTFHALQVDSMPFDFVFFFEKDGACMHDIESIDDLSAWMEERLENCKSLGLTEREFRASVYPRLVWFMAHTDMEELHLGAARLEEIVKRERTYFAGVRGRVIKERRDNRRATA